MEIKITTDNYGIKVWRSDKGKYPSYSVIKGKNPVSGRNEYQTVQFKRGIELSNGDEIFIRDAFITYRTWTDRKSGEEKCMEVWMITDFDYKREPEPERQIQQQMTSIMHDDLLDDMPDSFSAAEDEIPFK